MKFFSTVGILLIAGIYCGIFRVGFAADCQPTSDTYTTDSEVPERDPKFVPAPVTAIASDVPYVLDFKSNEGFLSYSNEQVGTDKEKASYLQVVQPKNTNYHMYRPPYQWWLSAQWLLHESKELPGLYSISNKNLKGSLVIVTQVSSGQGGNWVGILGSGDEFLSDDSRRNSSLWRLEGISVNPKVVAIYSHGFPKNGLLSVADAPNAGKDANYQFIHVLTQEEAPSNDLINKSLWKLGFASEEEKNPFSKVISSDASQQYQVENSCK